MRLTFKLISYVFLVLTFHASITFAVEMSKIDKLIESKKYSSAFEALKESDPNFSNPLVLSKMANIATYDYVYCINHESFAFKDLKSGERVEDFRGSKGKFKLHNFKLETELLKSIKQHPRSGELLLALANFYYSGICNLPQSKVNQAETYYLKAEKLGATFGFKANHNLGVIYLQKNKIKQAIMYLKKSVKEKGIYLYVMNISKFQLFKHLTTSAHIAAYYFC